VRRGRGHRGRSGRPTIGPRILTHHLNADLAGDLGLSCGGTVEIVIEPLVSAQGYVWALEQAAAAESGVVTTGLDWSAGPLRTSRRGPSRRSRRWPNCRVIGER
jgi:xanthine/CO dehydrogenase XdhC/CoxF family maturation factor